jgi:hypothetical protein
MFALSESDTIEACQISLVAYLALRSCDHWTFQPRQPELALAPPLSTDWMSVPILEFAISYSLYVSRPVRAALDSAKPGSASLKTLSNHHPATRDLIPSRLKITVPACSTSIMNDSRSIRCLSYSSSLVLCHIWFISLCTQDLGWFASVVRLVLNLRSAFFTPLQARVGD